MLDRKRVSEMLSEERHIEPSRQGDPDLGPLRLLPGTWSNSTLPGRGWNAIALPFATAPNSTFNYRLLLNQYNETLRFTLVDKAVKNRGISSDAVPVDADQVVVALDYEQLITQINQDDSPRSGKAGNPNTVIHHEPGLWLHLLDEANNGLDIARLAAIPHGDSVLALGRSIPVFEGAPVILPMDTLPLGVKQDLNDPYLEPYLHFHNHPFMGLFDPTQPHALLLQANAGVNILRTTQLTVDSTIPTGGISNIPFIVRQANATSMRSTFWIQELDERDINGDPKLRLQYLQVVMLEFFGRRDGLPGRIGWPHVSINTMEKVVERRVPGMVAAGAATGTDAEPNIVKAHEVAKAAR